MCVARVCVHAGARVCACAGTRVCVFKWRRETDTERKRERTTQRERGKERERQRDTEREGEGVRVLLSEQVSGGDGGTDRSMCSCFSNNPTTSQQKQRETGRESGFPYEEILNNNWTTKQFQPVNTGNPLLTGVFKLQLGSILAGLRALKDNAATLQLALIETVVFQMFLTSGTVS